MPEQPSTAERVRVYSVLKRIGMPAELGPMIRGKNTAKRAQRAKPNRRNRPGRGNRRGKRGGQSRA